MAFGLAFLDESLKLLISIEKEVIIAKVNLLFKLILHLN